MENFISIFVGIILLFVFVGYLWSVSWAVDDARKRGQSGGIVALLFWLFGPFSILIWLIIRPKRMLIESQPADYDDADDALAAASKLDSLGDWDAALELYQTVLNRWPEHAAYAKNCIAEIESKTS